MKYTEEKPMKYTEEKLEQTLDSIGKLLVLDEKKRGNMLELRTTLLRIKRAINPECWVNERSWRKIPLKERTKIMREERCVHFQSSGSIFQDLKDFPFFANKQWEKDRAKLIKEGEIVE